MQMKQHSSICPLEPKAHYKDALDSNRLVQKNASFHMLTETCCHPANMIVAPLPCHSSFASRSIGLPPGGVSSSDDSIGSHRRRFLTF